MTEGLPFIGRQAEMAKIESILFDWGTTHFVFLYSENGGIGKTRLLQEISARYSSPDYAERRLLIVPIIDFDDRSVNSRGTLQRKMVSVLGDEKFTEYLRRMVDWRKLESVGVSPEKLEEESNLVRREFQNCLNQISLSQRVVFLIDTTDKIEGAEIWNFLRNVLTEAQNIVIVISGRNAKTIHQDHFQNTAAKFRQTLLPLGPFTPLESEQYLQVKISKQIKNFFHDETVEKIKLLSRGVPILFDLALERLAQDDRFAEFLSQRPKEYFENLSIENRSESEKLMVSYLAEQRSDLAGLVLLLAHVYPANKAMLMDMLHVDSPAAIDELLKKALATVYIKQLPGERISLHDEMRRMVNEHVWSLYDPENNQRRDYSQKAADFFAKDIHHLTEQIERLQKSHLSLEDSIELDNFTRRKDTAQIEYLRHLLVIDANQGVEYYLKTVDEARKTHRLRFAQRMGSQIRDIELKLDTDHKYQVEIARLKQLIDMGPKSIPQVESALHLLLETQNGQMDKKLEILNLLGRCEELTGNYQQALKYQEEVLESVTNEEYRVRILNYTGYIYRLMGNWRKATSYYQEALEIAQSSKTISLNSVANIYNNLAYAVCLMGNYVEAKEYCLEAIRIWESQGITSSLGRGYLTRAVIYRDRGKYQNAAPFFKKAIEIFKKLEEPDDYKNLAGAYFDYAWSLWFEGDIFEYYGDSAEAQQAYKLSKDYFDSARDLAERYEVVSVLPGVVNQMSNIYWRLGFKEEARQMNEEAYQLSQKYNDIRYQIDSLLGFAEFDSEDQRYDRIEGYARELKEKYEDQGYEFPLFYGRMKRIQAEAALSKQDLDAAKLLYANGITQISQHGGYGLYFLDRELARLKKLMQDNLPPEKIIEWLAFFKSHWQQNVVKQEAKFGKLISWCSTFNNQIRFNHADN